MKTRIENWEMRLRNPNNNGYSSPESAYSVLCGKIYNHPKHDDGSSVVTSEILFLDLDDGYAVTRNTTYILGKPNLEWVQWLRENNYTLIENFIEENNYK